MVAEPTLTPAETVERLTALVGSDRVVTDADRLREVSQDRWKKYQSVHGIYNGPQPAALVLAREVADVVAVLGLAEEHRLPVVPRTGGSGTEGGLEVVRPGTIVLDGSGLDQIVAIDPVDMQVTARCGVRLVDLEHALRDQGLTTGHSPQSLPLAQLGGLVATRSIGQLSTLYGGIEDLVVGLEAVLPGGQVVRVRPVPRRAAGPDVRHVLIGNEGALAFVTEVTLRVFAHQPERDRFRGFLAEDLPAGVEVVREIVTAGYRPGLCRVYDGPDAAQHFSHLPGIDGRRAVLTFSAHGPERLAAATADGIDEIAGRHGLSALEPDAIRRWFARLTWGPDKLEAEQRSMLETGQLGYTTEVAASWSQVADLYRGVMARVPAEFPRAGDLRLLGAHSSHSYQTGTNLYFVYDYAIDCEPAEEIDLYHRPLNAIVVEEALRVGGSMVHHHGVGKYRTAWIEAEHGSSYALLRGLKETFDPSGVMNPGTLYPLR